MLVGCASAEIPKIKMHAEIPFLDGPEGVWVETVTHKKGTINSLEWKKKRPTMIMIDPEGWTVIKKNWLEACRAAGDNCNVQVDSIDKVILKLDELAREVLGGKK